MQTIQLAEHEMPRMQRLLTVLVVAAALVAVLSGGKPAIAQTTGQPLFHDAHLHLTNYVQEGTDISDFVTMMGDTIGRSTVFGLPLQQQWSYHNTGDYAPTYYLQTDAPLYYYSFTDAHIAMAYLSLSPEDQVRLDPMIPGCNPTDMYAADHIRRVLETFPGVFSGVGEFTIHKEFVSSKVAGEVASLTNPALDRIFEFSGKVGLVVLIHNDINMPFPKPDQEPYILAQMKALFKRHPDTTIIWAHIGVGRVVRPLPEQAVIVEKICTDPEMSHVFLDLSWEETAKYVTAKPETVERSAAMINRFPKKFLFGSDVVAPASADAMVDVFKIYAPLWEQLTPEARQLVLFGNYERIFDQARERVRAWEKVNVQ
jgi:predicted TIM-barrel fold metal-dependent hydrolase